MVLYFIFLFALIRAVFLCFQFNFTSFGWGSFYRKHLWCCLGANECLFALSGLISFHSTKVFGIVFLLLFSTNNYFQFHIHHTVSESQSKSFHSSIHETEHIAFSFIDFIHSSIHSIPLDISDVQISLCHAVCVCECDCVCVHINPQID